MNQLPLFEPHPPYQWHSNTSLEAAKAIEPSAETLRRKVLDFIRSQGSHGATDEEAQIALRLEGSTQRPRRVELANANLIRKTDRKRPTSSGRQATVWVSA